MMSEYRNIGALFLVVKKEPAIFACEDSGLYFLSLDDKLKFILHTSLV